MKKIYPFLFAGALMMLTIFGPHTANALSNYQSTYNATYGAYTTDCTLCHPGGNTSALTAAGSAFAPSHNYAAIAPNPQVTGFSIPATSTSLTVPITTFTATDNALSPLSPITSYMVTESTTPPSYNAAGWKATAPTSYTFATAGAKTLYAWARDYVYVVSPSRSASVTITLPPTSDTIAPTVTAFTIPVTSNSLTVPITTFTATDNVGVTGYITTETASAPSASAAGWSATAPTSYTFATPGATTRYAWAKDAAGNVSPSRSASVTITLPPTSDTIAPTVTAFRLPRISRSLTVPITVFTATDNVGVTGYMVSETVTKPTAADPGCSPIPPKIGRAHV